MMVKWVLRCSRGDRAGRAGPRKDEAGVVNRLAPGITCLDAGAAVSDRAGQGRLQRVITRMRVVVDDVLNAEAADYVPGAVKLRVRRKARRSSGKCIRER